MDKDDSMRIKKFVCTGTMTQRRKDIEIICEENGDVLQRSITKKTDYLVVGESPGKSKLEKAERYGIEVINENQFRDMSE